MRKGASLGLRRKTFALVLVVFGSAAALACSALLDLEPPPAGASDVAEGGPGTDSAAGPVDGMVIPGCDTRYVSVSSGSDGNTGCTPEKPLKSIRTALGAVDAVGAQGYVIKICGGTYVEDALLISLPGTLSGSWSCDFKVQSAAEGGNGTIVRLANPGSNNKTLLHVAPVAPKGAMAVTTVIQNLNLEGPLVAASVAVDVTNAAPTKIFSCRIAGADASMSRALHAGNFAAPEIFHDILLGGSALGTTALLVDGDATTRPAGPHVHDNDITAGGASAPATNIGSLAVEIFALELSQAKNNAFENNVVWTQSASSAPAVAVSISMATVDVVHNAISFTGTLLDGESSSNTSIGVSANPGSDVRIIANRILSGGKAGFGDFRAISLNGASSAVVVDNMLYGGEDRIDPTHTGIAVGVLVNDVPKPFIAGNSIFAGFPGSTKSAFGIFLQGTTADAVIDNNILAGAGVNDWAIKTNACKAGIAELKNNLVVGQSLGTLDIADCVTDGGASPKDISGMAAYVTASDQNLIMVPGSSGPCSPADMAASACIYDPRCTTSAQCLSAVIANWGSDDGFAAFAQGWSLAGTVSCRIAHGGSDLTANTSYPSTDYFGVMRNVPSAIGAAELGDGGCL